MKKFLLFSLMLTMTSSLVLLTGCNGDEEPMVEATCSDGIENGDETGVDCGGADCDPCMVGAHGTWQSTGDDISPLLAPFFSDLVVELKTDGTYTLDQTDLAGATTQVSGTFTQSESSVDGIWDIVLNQSAPALTATGIFRITGDRMEYEVAQTDPAIAGVTPPTATGGFGSTSGGVFGTQNVQFFNRL